MKKNILINNQQFFYEDEIDTLTEKVNSEMTTKDQELLLDTLKTLFDAKGIPFYLGYGTLLGAVRDNAFIKGDNDIDIMIKEKYEGILFESLPYFYENGLRLIRYLDHKTYSFRVDDKTFVDVYVLSSYKKFGLGSLFFYKCCFENWRIPKLFFIVPSHIVFIGKEYLIPCFSKFLLRCWYGKDWRIPQSKKGEYDFRNIGIIKVVRYIKDFIFK